jgi:hypothetical protein
MRNFGGGVDSFRPADELKDSQCQLMSNVIVRDNFSVRTRPGFQAVDSLSHTWASAVVANATITGGVQGMAFYNPSTTASKLLFVGVGNKLFTWDNSNWAYVNALNSFVPSASFTAEQGVSGIIFSDGSGVPVYFDGTTWTKYSGATAGEEIVITGCTMFKWCGGRMWAAGNTLLSDTIWFSKLLEYRPKSLATTTSWGTGSTGGTPSTYGSTRIGTGNGDAITALVPMQNNILCVLKASSVWLVSVQPGSTNVNGAPTGSWTATEVGSSISSASGCVGPYAAVMYENDVMFMSQDGVRSVQMMQAAAGQYQLSAALSTPVQPIIDRINWPYANLIRAVKYRHLVLWSVPLDNSLVNNYVIVYNGRLGAWTGYWTGVPANAMVATRFNNTNELYAGGSDGSVKKWADAQSNLNTDTTYVDSSLTTSPYTTPVNTGIPWEVDTRSFSFGNLDASKKPRAVLFRFTAGNCAVSYTATADLMDDDAWTNNVEPSNLNNLYSGNLLNPDGSLGGSFLLSSSSPIETYRSLEGLSYFNEMYFKIYSAGSGWMELRNITVTAFLKSVKDPNA